MVTVSSNGSTKVSLWDLFKCAHHCDFDISNILDISNSWYFQLYLIIGLLWYTRHYFGNTFEDSEDLIGLIFIQGPAHTQPPPFLCKYGIITFLDMTFVFFINQTTQYLVFLCFYFGAHRTLLCFFWWFGY